MSQQQRRAQEAQVVRRLTVGAGAAALGLAGYFTVSAASAAPIAVGGAGNQAAQQPAAAVQANLSDRVFVRRVHAPAIQPPAGGVRPAGTRAPGQVVPAQVATTQASTSAQPVAAPTAPAAPAATPAPQPTAATGGTKPR
jgi:hypothetical protein